MELVIELELGSRSEYAPDVEFGKFSDNGEIVWVLSDEVEGNEVTLGMLPLKMFSG